MSGYERYMNMLNGEVCDYVPRIPILMQYAAEYIGSNYAAFASDYNILVQANLNCAEDFGMDQVSCISDPYRETHGFGGKIQYVDDGVPRCSRPLESAKDLSILDAPDPYSSERMRDRINAARLFKTRAGGKYSILGWVEGAAAEAADLRGTANFFIDIIDDKQFALNLMGRCTEVAIAFGRAQYKAGCDTIGIGDAIASQVSFEVYKKLILPQEKALVNALKQAGARVRLHICGDITHILGGIKELDIDIIDVDHMVDISIVRDVLGQKVAIAGNLDPSSAVCRGKPENIIKDVRDIYNKAGNPYMVNAGCEIPSGTPSANLRALCKPLPYIKQSV